jgi:hypothetical protein
LFLKLGDIGIENFVIFTIIWKCPRGEKNEAKYIGWGAKILGTINFIQKNNLSVKTFCGNQMLVFPQ